MRILVIHQNFPGQFGHLVKAWSQRPGWDVRALGRDTAPGLTGFNGLVRYSLARDGNANQHPYLRTMEAATPHGQAALRAMLHLRANGFVPDVILAHPGWGETLYAKEVYPAARLVHLCEWFYNGTGADLGFDPEFPVTLDDRTRVRTWNALHTLNLTNCDVGIAPTHWQRQQHPEIFQPKIRVQHEGVATHLLTPDPKATGVTPSGVALRAGDPVVTFVARNLEPYRGFHIFMRALERIQREHPTCHALIVGSDTAPVREVISDGRNGRLVPFFDERAIARNAIEMMQTRKAQIPMRKQARADAQAYSFRAGVAGYDRAIGWGAAHTAAERASRQAARRAAEHASGMEGGTGQRALPSALPTRVSAPSSPFRVSLVDRLTGGELMDAEQRLRDQLGSRA